MCVDYVRGAQRKGCACLLFGRGKDKGAAYRRLPARPFVAIAVVDRQTFRSFLLRASYKVCNSPQASLVFFLLPAFQTSFGTYPQLRLGTSFTILVAYHHITSVACRRAGGPAPTGRSADSGSVHHPCFEGPFPVSLGLARPDPTPPSSIGRPPRAWLDPILGTALGLPCLRRPCAMVQGRLGRGRAGSIGRGVAGQIKDVSGCVVFFFWTALRVSALIFVDCSFLTSSITSCDRTLPSKHTIHTLSLSASTSCLHPVSTTARQPPPTWPSPRTAPPPPYHHRPLPRPTSPP